MAAFDMATLQKSDPIRIRKNELKNLPVSSLDNLEDSKLFEHFYWDMLDIEIDREVKYRVLLQIGSDKIQNV